MDGPIKKIMVYISGTEQSITAAQYAICLSRTINAELTALYIVKTSILSDLLKKHIFVKSEEEEFHRDLDADADKYLNYVKALARQKGLFINIIKTSGTVYQEIRNKILENEIDLLVFGELPYVKSSMDELYDGEEKAMRTVPCSVLIVKDEDRVRNLFDSLV